MEASNLVFIIAVEVGTLLTLLCVFLLVKNRRLRQMVDKLKVRMAQLVEDLRRTRDQHLAGARNAQTYKSIIEQQLEQTKKHHVSLKPDQDIALDIDPGVALPRRAAALRHAILSIELQATAANPDDVANWQQINHRYEQLFSFQQDYSTDENGLFSDNVESDDGEEVELIAEELKAAKKRISNLEKFRTLYLELEEKWDECKAQSQQRYDELSGMVNHIHDSEQKESFGQYLERYRSCYHDVASLIESGAEIPSHTPKSYDGGASREIKQLRAVAADQQRVILDLQKKLDNTEIDNESSEIVGNLKTQLEQQMRFVKESETCIQLMEDELTIAHNELEELKSRQHAIPELKSELKELKDVKEGYEVQVYTLRATNQRLNTELKKLKNKTEAKANGDSQQLKKQLLAMESKYADLEEKFLDLKLGS